VILVEHNFEWLAVSRWKRNAGEAEVAGGCCMGRVGNRVGAAVAGNPV
jgi:hypothetical protein